MEQGGAPRGTAAFRPIWLGLSRSIGGCTIGQDIILYDRKVMRTRPDACFMKTIRFERQGSIGHIVLANPPYNRLDLQFSHCLRDAVHEASSSDIRALVVSSEGEHFSFGGEVREWPGKDMDWFRTFVAEVNTSYRALEILRVPTVAAVRGAAFGGGFELALSCDFLVAADNAVFRCVEVTTGFIPIAGALQRLAERIGRSGASRFAMLGEPISGALAGNLGIATHVVASSMVEGTAAELAATLANGPTKAYAAVRSGPTTPIRHVVGRRDGASPSEMTQREKSRLELSARGRSSQGAQPGFHRNCG